MSEMPVKILERFAQLCPETREKSGLLTISLLKELDQRLEVCLESR